MLYLPKQQQMKNLAFQVSTVENHLESIRKLVALGLAGSLSSEMRQLPHALNTHSPCFLTTNIRFITNLNKS